MRPGDDPQDPAHELRVTDKRRFTATGEMREESEGAESDASPATEPAATPAPVAATSLPGPAPAPAGAGAGTAPEAEAPARSGRQDAVYDLGIESVFLIFHQSALIALGATVPGGTPGRIDLAEARQAITFLKVLEEKTRGNLTSDEAAMLQDLLSEAQMAYVQVARSMTGGGA